MTFWDPATAAVLSDESRPLEWRLTRFYQAHAKRFDASSVSGVLDARDDQIDANVVLPIAAALRQEAKFADLTAIPLLRGERELILTLHAAIVQLGIRKYRHQTNLPDTLGAHVKFLVQSFLDGAPTTLRRIHDGNVPAAFQTRLGKPPSE